MNPITDQKSLRDKRSIKGCIEQIAALNISRPIHIMEVCGTHTQTYFKFGLRSLMPKNINLISGPGCPVCITEDSFIDQAVELARNHNNVLATFGDLLKVPGSSSSLEKEREIGAHTLVVYSPQEALLYAQQHQKKRVIFLGVGFETTSPLTALVLKAAKKNNVRNFFVLSSHRLIPPALHALCQDKEMTVEGFLCPGHVSVVIGEKPYQDIAKNYQKGCVICGFEPLDMLLSIYMLMCQIKYDDPKVENEYSRVVSPNGNIRAQKILSEVFDVCDASWRGFGSIKSSGFSLNKEYKAFDAKQFITQKSPTSPKKSHHCLCADVVKGKIPPTRCPYFRSSCSPEKPLGPCMVSSEGSCHIYYEYHRA